MGVETSCLSELCFSCEANDAAGVDERGFGQPGPKFCEMTNVSSEKMYVLRSDQAGYLGRLLQWCWPVGFPAKLKVIYGWRRWRHSFHFWRCFYIARIQRAKEYQEYRSPLGQRHMVPRLESSQKDLDFSSTFLSLFVHSESVLIQKWGNDLTT